MQKRIALLFLAPFFTIFISGKLQAQALTLNYFTAVPSGVDVLVGWEVPDESGITRMQISRKIDSETEFKSLAELLPNGNKTYQYLDYSLFKDTPRVVTYRLQVFRSGMVFSYYTTVLHNPTSVQRTWGSIKAMFR